MGRFLAIGGLILVGATIGLSVVGLRQDISLLLGFVAAGWYLGKKLQSVGTLGAPPSRTTTDQPVPWTITTPEDRRLAELAQTGIEGRQSAIQRHIDAFGFSSDKGDEPTHTLFGHVADFALDEIWFADHGIGQSYQSIYATIDMAARMITGGSTSPYVAEELASLLGVAQTVRRRSGGTIPDPVDDWGETMALLSGPQLSLEMMTGSGRLFLRDVATRHPDRLWPREIQELAAERLPDTQADEQPGQDTRSPYIGPSETCSAGAHEECNTVPCGCSCH